MLSRTSEGLHGVQISDDSVIGLRFLDGRCVVPVERRRRVHKHPLPVPFRKHPARRSGAGSAVADPVVSGDPVLPWWPRAFYFEAGSVWVTSLKLNVYSTYVRSPGGGKRNRSTASRTSAFISSSPSVPETSSTRSARPSAVTYQS